MNQLAALQSEIDSLKSQIAGLSCEDHEDALRDIHEEFRVDLREHYHDSITLYLAQCFTAPLIAAFCALLFWVSYRNVRLWWVRSCMAKELGGVSAIADELLERKLTQAAWRSTTRRVCFFVVVKCLMAISCILFFVGMRFLMEASVRVWLRNVLTSPSGDDTTFYDNETGPVGGFALMLSVRHEMHDFLSSLLGLGWVRDLQSVYLFYLVGPGLLAFGLGVMKSAARDIMVLGDKFSLPLDTLKMYRAKRKEVHDLLIQKRMEEVMAKLNALADPSLALLEEDGRVEEEEEIPDEQQ